jgi:hypothetical protein
MSEDDSERRAPLKEQLVSANAEAKLYRGLFWSLLTVAAAVTIVHILHR